MLGQGCLRALFVEQSISTWSGFKMVVFNGLKCVQKWVKCGSFDAKMGENGSKLTFEPTLNPFRDVDKNQGVEIVFQKGRWGSPDPA